MFTIHLHVKFHVIRSSGSLRIDNKSTTKYILDFLQLPFYGFTNSTEPSSFDFVVSYITKGKQNLKQSHIFQMSIYRRHTSFLEPVLNDAVSLQPHKVE
jgi:hypothetical protein